MPYLGWTAHERLELWAAATLGRGEVTLADATAGSYDSAAAAWSAGAGIRGALLADGPTALALKGEAWVSQWEADGTGAGAGVDVDVQRLRLALEGQHAWTFASGAALAPSLEVGVRHDGGAGETGTGLELGGGIHWNDPARGLTLQTRARTLLGRGGYRQWGIAGQAHLDPGADGLGLTLNVAPGLGRRRQRGGATLGRRPDGTVQPRHSAPSRGWRPHWATASRRRAPSARSRPMPACPSPGHRLGARAYGSRPAPGSTRTLRLRGARPSAGCPSTASHFGPGCASDSRRGHGCSLARKRRSGRGLLASRL